MKDKVLVAKVVGAHGVKGAFKLRYFVDAPEDLVKYEPLQSSAGVLFHVKILHKKGDQVIVSDPKVLNRDQAEALKGVELYAARAAFESLPEDEFYITDLIGLHVHVNGVSKGQVFYVHNFGGGDVLEIKTADSHRLMIPFTKDAVPTVDIKAGYIDVAPYVYDAFFASDEGE